jgi:hypothetical protein
MQITITNPRLLSGIAAATAVYNATLGEGVDPLTPEQYLQTVAEGWAASYADQYEVGIISSAAFVLRFTPEEIAQIQAVAQVSPEVAGYLSSVVESKRVFLWIPEVTGGLDALVQAGLLTQERRDAILAF